MRLIIAVRRGGLGDLLAALPSLRFLRAAFPKARIVLVARPAYGRLLASAGVVDAVEDADEFRWAALASIDAARAAAGRLHPSADLVVGWFHSPTPGGFPPIAAALWPSAEIRAFASDLSASLPLNRSFFNQTAGAFRRPSGGVPGFDECVRLPLPAREPTAGRRILFPREPYAVVHPGAGSRDKLWPGERFREVIRRAAEGGFGGAVVLGESEAGLRAEWNNWSGPADSCGWILVDRPPLEDLAALLAGASFYAGNDSGPTHLAAVLGTRGVAVFKDVFVRAWNPGGRITIVSSPDVREIPARKVTSHIFCEHP